MLKEHKKLLEEAKLRSDNPNTKTAALLLRNRGQQAVYVGTNHLPQGVAPLADRLVRPAYYSWICHAERDAIYYCAGRGLATAGMTMVMEWFPCIDCARAIILAGIAELQCDKPDFNDPRWGEDFKIAFTMLEESPTRIIWNEELT